MIPEFNKHTNRKWNAVLSLSKTRDAMKILKMNLVLLSFTLTGLAQEPFNCPDWDFYNRDTTLHFKVELEFDTITNHYHPVFHAIDASDKNFPETFIDTLITFPRFKYMDDQKRLENLQVCCIDWLLKAPVDQYADERSAIDKFIESSHLVSVLVDENLLADLQKQNPGNEYIEKYYRYGVIRYLTIKTHESDDSKIQLAGILAVNDFYAYNPGYSDEIPDMIRTYEDKQDESALLGEIRKKLNNNTHMPEN